MEVFCILHKISERGLRDILEIPFMALSKLGVNYEPIWLTTAAA
jgi:hypothetical protein